MAFTLEWEERGVLKRFSGPVSFQEYARSQEMVLGDPRTDDLRYIINDLLGVESYSITTEQAEYLAAFNYGASRSNPGIRVAYVTTDGKIRFLIRLMSPLSSYEIRAFATVAEARAWAGGERSRLGRDKLVSPG